MPNHVHALVWLPEPKDLTRFLYGWKRMSSFRIRQWYAEHASNYFADFGPGERFWQPRIVHLSHLQRAQAAGKTGLHALESRSSGPGAESGRVALEFGPLVSPPANRWRADHLDRMTLAQAA